MTVSDKTTLVSADFSQIEARVLAWLAGEKETLDAFARNDDVYVLAAAGIYRVPPGQVTKAQRLVGKVAVLALGYQGGAGALTVMADAYGLTLEETQKEEIKVGWRRANRSIVQFWYDVENTARDTVLDGRTRTLGCLKFGAWGRHLLIQLPSGRHLVYRDACVSADNEISFMGLDQYPRKWKRITTYGGKLVENITQAVARDCMRDVMLQADELHPDELILTVHDELLAEVVSTEADARLATYLELMSTPPAWAPGLPVAGDGWVGQNYRK